LQLQIKDEFVKVNKKTKKSGKEKSGSKKRKLDDDNDDELNKVLTSDLPMQLQKQLYRDWQYIFKRKFLVPLPRSPSASEILDNFAKTTQGEKEFEEVVDGIRLYFDKCLGTLLLYRFERHQYVEIVKQYPSKSLSEIYGAEHLLRLTIKLPQIIKDLDMEEKAKDIIRSCILDLLKYMNINFDILFPPNLHEPATPDYIKTQDEKNSWD